MKRGIVLAAIIFVLMGSGEKVRGEQAAGQAQTVRANQTMGQVQMTCASQTAGQMQVVGAGQAELVSAALSGEGETEEAQNALPYQEPEDKAKATLPDQGDAAAGNGEEEKTDSAILEYLEIQEISDSLQELTDLETLSFSGLVLGLIRGEIPLNFEEICQKVREIFFGEILNQKDLALQILLIVLVSAVFSNFVRVFENNQIAEISFYMMYLLISTLLMKSFSSMNLMVTETLEGMSAFMKVLLPSYLITVVFSSGSVTALGFYELTLLAIHILQIFIIKIVIPMINFYLILLILNQMTKEDYFSRFAELLQTIADWSIRTVVGVTIGLHAVQCLIAPAVDSLKNSAAHRIAKSLPGIGTILDSAAETVVGSALVIKNAVGVAGMIGVLAICLAPLLKMAACILMFRLLCALIQPVSEKRMVDCIESISRGAMLLFRILLAGLSIFVISLAMVTASVKGV